MLSFFSFNSNFEFSTLRNTYIQNRGVLCGVLKTGIQLSTFWKMNQLPNFWNSFPFFCWKWYSQKWISCQIFEILFHFSFENDAHKNELAAKYLKFFSTFQLKVMLTKSLHVHNVNMYSTWHTTRIACYGVVRTCLQGKCIS